MRFFSAFFFLVLACSCSSSRSDTVSLSQELLYAKKTGSSPDSLLQLLAEISPEALNIDLHSHTRKLAFWINIYNAMTIHLIEEDPVSYQDLNTFFQQPRFRIAGQRLSLDFVEHVLLRRQKGKQKWAELSGVPWESLVEKWSANYLDKRLHFALNCGAESCPPIAFYSETKIDGELDLAQRSFLSGDSTYNPDSNVLELSKILEWYAEDFGGESGVLALHRQLGIVPKNAQPEIRYREYDWTANTKNYR